MERENTRGQPAHAVPNALIPMGDWCGWVVSDINSRKTRREMDESMAKIHGAPTLLAWKLLATCRGWLMGDPGMVSLSFPD